MGNNTIHTVFNDAKNRLFAISPYLIIGILLLVLLFQCEANTVILSRQEQNKKIANDTIKYFKNELGTLTASVNTANYIATEYKKQLLQRNKQLQAITKKFSTIATVQDYKIAAVVDPIFIPIGQNIALDTTGILAQTGKVKKDWFSFNYEVKKAGITLDSIHANIGIVSVTGFKKNWFLGKKTAITDVASTTPGVIITDLKSANIVVPKKWYETNIFLIATGFALRSLIH